jgi:hypothetical protein
VLLLAPPGVARTGGFAEEQDVHDTGLVVQVAAPHNRSTAVRRSCQERTARISRAADLAGIARRTHRCRVEGGLDRDRQGNQSMIDATRMSDASAYLGRDPARLASSAGSKISGIGKGLPGLAHERALVSRFRPQRRFRQIQVVPAEPECLGEGVVPPRAGARYGRSVGVEAPASSWMTEHRHRVDGAWKHALQKVTLERRGSIIHMRGEGRRCPFWPALVSGAWGLGPAYPIRQGAFPGRLSNVTCNTLSHESCI